MNCKNPDKCTVNIYFSIQGFRGDEKIGDVVRCAMFSNTFPSLKSPEELAFEAEMESVIKEGDVNIDELSAAEFVTDGENEEDDEEMIDVVEQLGLLEDITKRKKSAIIRDTNDKESRKENEKGKIDIQKMKENMGQMNNDDKEAVAAVFTSVKEMRRAAQLNYKALTRVRNVMMKYPPLDFLYKVMKPIGEIMPQDQINTGFPLLMMTPVEGGKTQEKNKIKRMAKKCIKCIPKKVYRNGVAFHQCSYPDCKYTRKSWGAIDTHIMIEHLKCKYVCKECEKELTSSDGLRRHMQVFHSEKE